MDDGTKKMCIISSIETIKYQTGQYPLKSNILNKQLKYLVKEIQGLGVDFVDNFLTGQDNGQFGLGVL